MTPSPFTAMRVAAPSAPLLPFEVDPSPPGEAEVTVRVEASGICGADAAQIASAEPEGGFPIVPGHEIAGTVAAVGASAGWLEIGEPVAIGWFGGSCGHCRFCRAGDVVHCPERRTPGRSYAGAGPSSSPCRSTRSRGSPTACRSTWRPRSGAPG